MNDIDDPIPNDMEFSHTTRPYAVLKNGITKKKGEPIYDHEVEYYVPAAMVYKKKKNIEYYDEPYSDIPIYGDTPEQ